ncbi:hypothetical protein J1N35_022191 [Gossypium stocksii]|uniref:Uncharacterized protein n=1 Tax=Gossypium stocksii TaxID=47602 RepID=A0A9D3VFM1_9ROSI|nr:hypothetical protein J1N35_022191 [Gossypium stocksii]
MPETGGVPTLVRQEWEIVFIWREIDAILSIYATTRAPLPSPKHPPPTPESKLEPKPEQSYTQSGGYTYQLEIFCSNSDHLNPRSLMMFDIFSLLSPQYSTSLGQTFGTYDILSMLSIPQGLLMDAMNNVSGEDNNDRYKYPQRQNWVL